MIGKFKDPSIWGPHLAVAAAYAACYEVVRYFSFTHWMITAGLRLGCLLLVQRRFWPALVLGEFLPIAEKIFLGGAPFGAAWASIATIPPILLCAPVFALLHKHMPLIREDGRANMVMILTAALVCAGATTGIGSMALSVIVMPDGSTPPPVSMRIVLAWLLGNYLGALTIVPTVLALRERIMRIDGPLTWAHVWHSPLLREILCVEGPILIALLAAVHFVGGNTTPYMRMAMVIPVVLLAVRHGWHGAAIGGMLASVALAGSAIATRDPSMIPAQVTLAFAISTSLLLGLRVKERRAVAKQADARINPVTR
ncbi:MASE1 domain-containing protein [Luteibacter aegosomatis]|uniref:MASE1 domain-containing protein n=1 Tax=Luteibacter aegosomatis TaxID=2911537 RepID=UPI001FFB8A20|nr:MASE1 domain-containing protein [Luteibacter aegosomatis]UPG85324.1 MASE1 domain-containing protein [Luteibacter aegosomatis]